MVQMKKFGFFISPNTLFVNARRENINMMKICLDKGIDINVKNPPFNITAISEAAFYGKLNSVKFLIDNGCDVNIISRETTPFLDACIKGHVETALYLLDNGADPFIEVPGELNYYNLLKNGRIDKDIIMKIREKQDLENE